MDDSRLKRFVQGFAVRTQFAPFTWAYRALYALAVRACVREVRRERAVRSIYLHRGMTNCPLYGLSDIDLFIIVDSEDIEAARDRIRERCDRLGRFIPMLVTGEQTVMTEERVRVRSEHSLRHRFLFWETGRTARHLWGEHIPALFPRVSDEEARWLAAEGMQQAWYHLAHELQPDNPWPLYLRRYCNYKWVAEAARAALITDGASVELSRDDALEPAIAAYPNLSDALREVRRWRRELLCRTPIPVDMVLDAFWRLAERAYAARELGARPRRRFRVRAAPPDSVKAILGEESLAAIGDACTGLQGPQRAVLVPKLVLDASARLGQGRSSPAGAPLDAYDLVILGARRPAAEQLVRFNAALARFWPTVTPFYSNGVLAISLRQSASWGVKHRRCDGTFFAGLSCADPLTDKLAIAGEAEGEAVFQSATPLRARARSLLSLFRRPAMSRMPLLRFLRLFWEAGRACVLTAQDQESVIDAPVTSGQVLQELVRLRPQNECELRRLHAEYLKEVHGEQSEAAQYVQWASRYVLALQETLFPSDDP